MVKQDKGIKEKIIHATIELIKKHGDISKITVRDIAANAGVGIGLINYHFQTKDESYQPVYSGIDPVIRLNNSVQ